MKNEIDRDWFDERILERFLRYVRIDTASDRHSKGRPTTAGQWDLARMILEELKTMGVRHAELDDRCFLTASLGPNPDAGPTGPPAIGFMAHMDTSEEVSGKNVRPRVRRTYNGKAIRLNAGIVLDPEEFPDLKRYTGKTVVTTDGTTLLGADDKAGIAEIITAAEYLLRHLEIPHGKIELIFTPDEETGFGMDLFPLDRIESRLCYTLDGSGEDVIETECFEAYRVDVEFHGKSFHLGYARGKLVNAVEMASAFISMIPKEESPQATDGRYGYYCPLEINGTVEAARTSVFIRDFDPRECLRRVAALRAVARACEHVYPGGKIKVKQTRQYSNMKAVLDRFPQVTEHLREAVKAAGNEPEMHLIRGGTDGARLTEKGIPTPNIFTGGYNYHSNLEWAALPAMVKASLTVVHLARIWGKESGRSRSRKRTESA